MLADDSAQGLVEYSLGVALVSLVAVGALKTVGHNTSTTLSNLGSNLK